MTKKTPSPQDMRLAAHWLRCNEGGDGESDICASVAEWLDAKADDKELAWTCREFGVSVAVARKSLRR